MLIWFGETTDNTKFVGGAGLSVKVCDNVIVPLCALLKLAAFEYKADKVAVTEAKIDKLCRLAADKVNDKPDIVSCVNSLVKALKTAVTEWFLCNSSNLL